MEGEQFDDMGNSIAVSVDTDHKGNQPIMMFAICQLHIRSKVGNTCILPLYLASRLVNPHTRKAQFQQRGSN